MSLTAATSLDVTYSTTVIPVDALDPKTSQLVREAKIGLTICALLVGLFCYVAWNRFSNGWDKLPQHVRNAPLAQDMSEFYKAELRENQLEQQSFTDSDTPAVVSRTIPENETPISFNELRADNPAPEPEAKVVQPDSQVEPVGFENDGNSFQPFRAQTKPELASTAENSGNNNPFAELEKPKRHVFEIEDMKLLEPKVTDSPKVDSIQNDFKIQPFAPKTENQPPPVRETPEALNTLPEKHPLGAEGDFVPLSSSAVQPKITARTTFQVQVEPEVKPEVRTLTTTASSMEPVFKEERPVHIPDRQLDPDSFLKAMPNSSTCLQSPEKCVEKSDGEKPVERLTFAPIEQPTAAPIVSHRFKSAPSPAAGFRTARLEDHDPETIGKPIPSIESRNLNTDENKIVKRRDSALQDGLYIVSENETLWSISQAVYEDGRLFRALYEVNRNQIPDPNSLQPGVEIKTPPLEELILNWESSVPVDLCPSQLRSDVHITQKGDTLFHVARIRLGQASRFDEILELNRSRLNLDTHHLTELPPGLPLSLPQGQ